MRAARACPVTRRSLLAESCISLSVLRRRSLSTVAAPAPSVQHVPLGSPPGGARSGVVVTRYPRRLGIREPEAVQLRGWTPESKRVGALAMKAGMMALFDRWGERHAVTVLQLDDCQVTQVKRDEDNGYCAMQLGLGEAKAKTVTKPLMGHYARAGVAPKRKLWEFRVTPDALLPVGTRIRARHFLPGQNIDVCGLTKGKGFQGAMKRWGFAGQPASHGVSKTHRHLGSTGQCQDPGKVFKGKKMAGRMGNKRVTVECLKILKIDPERDLLFVKGHVPGQNGGFLRIRDAWRRSNFPAPPPFPTFMATPEEEGLGELWAQDDGQDPLLQIDEEIEA